MFGDLFGQRGTYVEGTFYAGRKKYLNTTPESLLPPDGFRNRRQIRSARSREENRGSDNNRNMIQIKFQQKRHEEEADHHHYHQKKFKKVANMVRNIVTFEHFSSTAKEDWIETTEAGVHMWVNKGTGEVSTLCPWRLRTSGENSAIPSPIPTARNHHRNTDTALSHGLDISGRNVHSAPTGDFHRPRFNSAAVDFAFSASGSRPGSSGFRLADVQQRQSSFSPSSGRNTNFNPPTGSSGVMFSKGSMSSGHTTPDVQTWSGNGSSASSSNGNRERSPSGAPLAAAAASNTAMNDNTQQGDSQYPVHSWYSPRDQSGPLGIADLQQHQEAAPVPVACTGHTVVGVNVSVGSMANTINNCSVVAEDELDRAIMSVAPRDGDPPDQEQQGYPVEQQQLPRKYTPYTDDEDDSSMMGTGALVYDSSELDNLFMMLDDMK